MVKLLLKVIGAIATIWILIMFAGLFCGHFRKLQSFHQAVHSSDADGNAIVTLKYIGDFIGAKPFVITSVNLQNKSCDFLVFFGAISWICGEVFIIRASVNTKNFAKKFYVMLKT